MRRHLRKNEWQKVNQEVEFEDLQPGMEVTVDDTINPGWYVVVSTILNGYVILEELESLVEDYE